MYIYIPAYIYIYTVNIFGNNLETYSYNRGWCGWESQFWEAFTGRLDLNRGPGYYVLGPVQVPSTTGHVSSKNGFITCLN